MQYLIVFSVVFAVSVASPLSCGPNEVDTRNNTCQSACEPSCETPEALFCTEQCVQRDCSCKPGFYRNEAKKCVPWKECPEQTHPCAALTCLPGSPCEAETIDCGNPPCPQRGICKPSPVRVVSCSDFPCRRCGDACEMIIDDPTCNDTNCSQHPECIPQDVSSCKNVRCTANTACRMIPVTCITCPCWPQPRCVPDPTL